MKIKHKVKITAMLEARKYTLGELMEVMLTESQGQAKPVVGNGVWKDNSKNNEKAVEDIMKQTEESNGAKGEKGQSKPENAKDFNKTTLDVNFSYEPSKEYKERVKAQAKGFPSVQNEKETEAKENKSLGFEGNEEFYKRNSEKNKEVSDKEAEVKHAGLKSHNLPKEDFENKTIFTNENKKMKRLIYNKVFLNEEHVLKKVPDDYKVDGNRFVMKDAKGVEYIVECAKDKVVDYVHTKVVQVINREALAEQMERMKQLTDYKSSKYFGSLAPESRERENRMVSESLGKMKKLAEDLKK